MDRLRRAGLAGHQVAKIDALPEVETHLRTHLKFDRQLRFVGAGGSRTIGRRGKVCTTDIPSVCLE